MVKEKLPTIKMKNFGDFMSKYIKCLTDTDVLEVEGKLIPSISFKPKAELQKICGFEEQPSDPYDDFDYYIAYEFVLEDGVVTICCGDNFETKDFKLVGDTRTIKGMLEELVKKVA